MWMNLYVRFWLTALGAILGTLANDVIFHF